MELTQLTYFLTVAQMQHMTHAAEALHIAQPALTKSVQRLESELGVPLIARKGRGIALTPYGQRLADELQQPLNPTFAHSGNDAADGESASANTACVCACCVGFGDGRRRSLPPDTPGRAFCNDTAPPHQRRGASTV